MPPASRAYVTPASNVRRSICAASSTRSDSGARNSSMVSSDVAIAWRWQSITPGITQRPLKSKLSESLRRLGPTSTMTPCSTETSQGPWKPPASSSVIASRRTKADGGRGLFRLATRAVGRLSGTLSAAELVGGVGARGQSAARLLRILDDAFEHREARPPADDLRVEREHQDPAGVSHDQVVNLVPPHLFELARVRQQSAVLRWTVMELELGEVSKNPHKRQLDQIQRGTPPHDTLLIDRMRARCPGGAISAQQA